MDLNTYFLYAVVTAIIALIVIIIALTYKSVLDEQTFVKNYMLARDFALEDQKRMLDGMGVSMSFDDHVASTPGMHNLN